jgi:hypothetical protein
MADVYRLDILPRAQRALSDALAISPKAQRKLIVSVCADIFRRLETKPFEFGEELYDLKSLQMQVRIGIQLPLAIHYGADQQNQIVIIQNAMLLS